MSLYHAPRNWHIPFTKYWISVHSPLGGLHLITIGPYVWRLNTWREGRWWHVHLKTHQHTTEFKIPVRLLRWKASWLAVTSRIDLEIHNHHEDQRRRHGRA